MVLVRKVILTHRALQDQLVELALKDQLVELALQAQQVLKVHQALPAHHLRIQHVHLMKDLR